MKNTFLKKLTSYQRLVWFIKEREAVRLKKEAGNPSPWTDNEILGNFRFTNVRRMDDKVSLWLLNQWYKPYFNHPRMLHAVALARFTNKIETMELLTEEVFTGKSLNWNKIQKILRDHKSAGNVIFGAAYMIRGNSGRDKVEAIIDFYVKPLKNSMLQTDSMEQTHSNLQTAYGLGSFMAGQITADLRHAVKGTWADKMTWAPIGPGSQKGMNYVHNRLPRTSLNQTVFLLELRDLVKKLKVDIPKSIFDRCELMDFQNCLCEHSKMERTLLGEGRPKQLYKESK